MHEEYRDDILSSVMNTIADPIMVVDEEGRYLEVFGGTDRSLYDDGRPLKGKMVSEILTKEFGQFFVNQVRHTIATGTLNVFDYRLDTQTVNLPIFDGPGGTQWFEARMYPLEQPIEGKRAVVAMIINISERRALHRRLHELSYKDPLTGLYNRRYFLEQVNVHFLEKNSIHLMFGDIDHFKAINDRYGHLAGDEVIRELAAILQSILGETTTICRLGGDEFIAALVNSTDEQALELAEKVRSTVEDHRFMHQNTPIEFTVSIGIAPVDDDSLDSATLIGHADKALYEAKEAGRNCVCLYNNPPKG